MPDRIGGYTVTGSLGVGGMGSVYLARDPRFDRDVAIKVLHPQYREDPGIIERFKSEAVIQAKLSHPNIVTVLDFIAEGDTLAMVMEYIDGKPLDRVIEECRGPMEPERAIRIMGQVLDAMGFAHSKGLVHRDIKPSNIMIQDLGGKEFAKVMDFGIAKILGSEKLRTATGAKMGTLAYMSPEHVKSPKYVDARSDIYSLGVVFYEMLTGKVPFDADSEYELMRQIVEQEPRVLPASGVIGPMLARSLKRALQKAPAQRFASCGDFHGAISGEKSGRWGDVIEPPPVAGSSGAHRAAQQVHPPAGQPIRRSWGGWKGGVLIPVWCVAILVSTGINLGVSDAGFTWWIPLGLFAAVQRGLEVPTVALLIALFFGLLLTLTGPGRARVARRILVLLYAVDSAYLVAWAGTSTPSGSAEAFLALWVRAAVLTALAWTTSGPNRAE